MKIFPNWPTQSQTMGVLNRKEPKKEVMRRTLETKEPKMKMVMELKKREVMRRMLETKKREAMRRALRGEVSQLMQDIFRDNEVSEDEEDKDKKAEFEDEDEPKLIRVEPAEDDVEQDSFGRTWDLDVMLAKKKQEIRRRRRKVGSIDLMADADDQTRELEEAMNEAEKVSKVTRGYFYCSV
ncbi:hypothetical protein niasHT_008352 [Heterodera trifolii]|uniref:Uncharacterized protein n=1 Tax=Heterodera trifolii TaxID=157864 RepID=A0ABD2M1H9_9BILA